RCASVIFCLAVLAAPTDLGTLSLHDALPILGYKTPVLKTAGETWEPYALEVLAGILDGGASARFARELVRGQQVAAGAGAGYNLYARGDGLFTLSGTPAQGRTMEELEQALREQVRRVRWRSR